MSNQQPLKLRSVKVSGVRGIGWGHNSNPGLDLPILADVTIISGPNGLGKSSIIDSLRLALMGDVLKHRKRLEWDHLRHRIDNSGPSGGDTTSRAVEVHLGFDNDQSLLWRAHDAQGQDQAAKAARNAASVIMSLGTATDSEYETGDSPETADHLRLTHFLPQGWGDRFTELDNTKDGWSLIEQALALEGLHKAVKTAQGKQGVQGSLNTLWTESEQDSTLAKQEVEAWATAVAEWQEAAAVAVASGALDPASVRELLKVPASGLDVDISNAPDGGIVLIDQAIKRTAATNRTDNEKLSKATNLAALWTTQCKKVEEATGIRVQANNKKQKHQTALSKANDAFGAAQRILAQAKLPALRIALESSNQELRERRNIHLAWKNQRRAIALQALSTEAKRLAVARTSYKADEKSTPTDAALGLVYSKAETVHSKHQRALVEAIKLLNNLRTRHGELVRLLQELRPHVEQDGYQCPVCSVEYEPGELLKALDLSLTCLEDEAMHTAAEAKRTAEEACTAAQTALNTAQSALDKQALSMSRLKERRLELDTAERQLRKQLPDYLVSTPLSELMVALIDQAHYLLSDRPCSNLESAALASTIEQAARDETAAERNQQEATARVEQASIRAGTDALNKPPPLDINEAQRVLDRAVEDKSTAEAMVNAANKQWLEDKLTEERAQESTAATLASWSQLGLSDKPSERSLDLANATLHQSKKNLGIWAATLETARIGANQWLSVHSEQLALGRLKDLARAKHCAEPSDSVPFPQWVKGVRRQFDSCLDTAKKKAEVMGRQAGEFRQIITNFSNVLTNTTNNALPPILKRQQAFQAVLTPGIPWRIGATKYRSKLTMKVTPVASSSSPSADVNNITRLLSEGEHTAIALSFLLAFHTQFRWSRWPALVLDDPFQAADVVRIASLLNVLRNVAIHQGSQLILTTHDAERANWIRRKMTNGGLSVVHYALTTGPHGIVARRE
jgi:hypothetical protein